VIRVLDALLAVVAAIVAGAFVALAVEALL
jgi:hypothetical protein